MNNSQLAHVWAQQTKAEGVGSNFFFKGPTIYSYGYHFPVARFIEHGGKKAVLFTTRTYGNSTAKHINHARGALYGLPVPVFNTSRPTDAPDSKTTRAEYAAQVAKLVETAARARTRGQWSLDQAISLVAEANDCAAFFGWRWRLPVPELAPDTLAKLKAEHAAQIAKDKAKNAKEEKRRARELADLIKDWRGGAAANFSYTVPTMLRVQGDKVQTSRGAEIPAAHAGQVWRAVCEVMRTGTPYQRNGHTIHAGEFAIDSIDTAGTLHAGCHTIAYAELAGVAKVLGLEGGAE